jgi:hypothetical protein
MTQMLLLLALFAGDGKEADQALEKFKSAYKSDYPSERVKAIQELSQVQHDKIAKRLGSLLGQDEREVRVAAAAALGEYKENKKLIVATLLNGLGGNAKLPEVQDAILGALGKLQDDSAYGPLRKLWDQKDLRMAKAAIQTTGQIRCKGAIEPMIKLLEKFEKDTKDPPDLGGGGGFGDLPDVGGGTPDPNYTRAVELKPVVLEALRVTTNEPWPTSTEWWKWWVKHAKSFKIEK